MAATAAVRAMTTMPYDCNGSDEGNGDDAVQLQRQRGRRRTAAMAMDGCNGNGEDEGDDIIRLHAPYPQ
jgi:hypothetical protein